MSVIKTNRLASSRLRIPPRIVRLSPDVLQALSSEAENLRGSRNTRIIGLLFGESNGDSIAIEAILGTKTDLAHGQSNLIQQLGAIVDELLSRPRLRSELLALELLGWCSIEQGTGRDRDQDDLPEKFAQFHEVGFRRVTDVLLRLILQSNGGLSGRLFARLDRAPFSPVHCSAGAITVQAQAGVWRQTEVELFRFEDDLYLGAYGRTASDDMADLGATPLGVFDGPDKDRLVAEPVAAALDERRSWLTPNGQRGLWVAASLALFVLGFVIAYLSLHTRTARDQGPVVRDEGSPLTFDATYHTQRLDLQVQRQTGGAFLVTWNRDAPTIRSALGGTFEIRDGSFTHRTELEPSELASGSILYTMSRSNEIHFQLTVTDAEHRAVTDQVFFLDSSSRSIADNRAEAPVENRDQLTPASPVPIALDIPSGELPHRVSSAPQAVKINGMRTAPPESPRRPVQVTPAIPVPTQLATAEQVSAAQAGLDIAPPALEKKSVPQSRPEPNLGSNGIASHVGSAPVLNARPAVPENAGPAYVEPRPLRKVAPNSTLLQASHFAGRQTIEVEVDIDDRGRVTGARIPKGVRREPGLAGMAAVSAARQWLFEPAKMHGKNVPSKHVLVFEFMGQSQ